MNGIFLVNKPTGLTSHDVVFKVKKKFNLKKVGHTGTLDPFATGLLIIMVGKATKLAFLFEELDKRYTGKIVFGNKYDTDDITGQIIESKPFVYDADKLNQIIQSLMPSYNQLPPNYSAVKVGGQKAYEAARSGKPLELSKRLVKIYEFKYDYLNNELNFDAFVSKGTYIRSIARDIGENLNSFGALSLLNRTIIGKYSIKDAKTIDELEASNLIEDIKLLSHVRKLELSDYIVKLVKNGVHLDHRQTHIPEPFVVTDKNGNYIAYYEPLGDKFIPKYIF
ncbi:tRNA pseudouridine(55) synthase TruB [Acholeplasma granularum]|uniref:tRNA pseudouridine(55) synthase TruB n=1 Tax=Acholeplasma granularum TaxID=264635 RepID=UPI0004706ED9|nr:tRNA pseudouridine(55) synthase TruB [Acholeplasma granularum]